MANAVCFASGSPIAAPLVPSRLNPGPHRRAAFPVPSSPRGLQPLRAQKSGSSKKKETSIVCQECQGNGAKACGQCEGTGVNSKDHFNGKFKAGGLCWLCRGKRDVLCGECNGAGFLGGFMSTFDETSS